MTGEHHINSSSSIGDRVFLLVEIMNKKGLTIDLKHKN